VPIAINAIEIAGVLRDQSLYGIQDVTQLL
jgi:hypothetical protein